MFYLLVLLSLISTNTYDVTAVTLDASMLNQLGYNNQSLEILINFNNIDNIDPNAFNGYTNVTRLNLQHNALLKVDLEAFKDMVNLKFIDFSYNPLAQVTNPKKIVLSNMRNFYITQCPVTSFDSNVTNALPNLDYFFGNLPSPIKPNQLSPWNKLTYLLVSTKNQTSLTKEHFNGLSSLYYLTFTDSNIKTIEVHSLLALPNVAIILLSNNAVTSLEYLQIPSNAQTLDLDGNKMNYFMLSRTMGVLRRLRINNNLFRSFKSMDFTFLTNLTYLDLSNNPHAYPYEIAGHLKPLVNLTIIEISNLSISSIDSNYFKNNSKLQTIGLSRNKIIDLPYNTFSHLTDLTFLYLDYNQISVLDNRTFIGVYKPIYIFFQYNQLTNIFSGTFYNLSILYHLDLSCNLISEIGSSAFTGCFSLRNLYLNNNRISNILPRAFETLALDYLYLGYNQILELSNSTFAGMISIGSLDLNYNNISVIRPGAFNSVNITQTIKLSNNRLTRINNDTFAGQTLLSEIHLSDNMISTIEAGAFNSLSNLQTIYLNGNNLTYLDYSTFAGCDKLQGIFLSNNPNLSQNNLQSLCPTTAVNCQVIY